jgi:hypothetical protein
VSHPLGKNEDSCGILVLDSAGFTSSSSARSSIATRIRQTINQSLPKDIKPLTAQSHPMKTCKVF